MSGGPVPTGGATPERIALGLTALLLLAGLTIPAIGWDWLFDTAFLLAAGWLALAAPGRGLVVCAYLFTDAALRLLVSLVLPGPALPFWLGLTGLYGLVLGRRLRAGGVLPWRALLRAPARWTTLAALVPLACLYRPMLHFHHADHADLPPMILSFGQVTVMGPAGRLDLGAELTYYGVQVAFARAAGLLLAGIVLVRLGALAGLVTSARARRFGQVAAIGVALWWLWPAKGWHSLDTLPNLLFAGGLSTLMALHFRTPDRSIPAAP